MSAPMNAADAAARREQGLFDDALSLIDTAIRQTQSTDIPAWREHMLFRGETLAFLGRYDDADAAYTAVLAQGGAVDAVAARCHVLTCALRLSQGRIDHARRSLEAAERCLESERLDDDALLDLRFNQTNLQLADGRYREASDAAFALREQYDDRIPAGLRGRAYCDLLAARAALAMNDVDRAVAIAGPIEAARRQPALRQVAAQAMQLIGEAHYKAARFAEAVDAFERCVKQCDSHPGSRPTLRRVRAGARIGLAAATRARGRAGEAIPVLRDVRESIRRLDDTENLSARCLLSLAISYIAVATDAADDAAGRRALASARSALQEARMLCDVIERGEILEVRVLTLLAHVQRSLGRRRQARASLARAGQLSETGAFPHIDRADYLAGRAIDHLDRAEQHADEVDAAEHYFRLAREQYESAGTWYELARTDQNLALVDIRRADTAIDLDEQHIHLRAAVDKLVPALLAKFAVRFTLMSTELRRSWTAGQQRAFELLLSIGERLGDEQLIADLVLTSRIHGVLTPIPSPAFDAPPTDEQRPSEIFVEASASATTGPVADLLGFNEQPSRLAPAPMLVAPNEHWVFADHAKNAIARYSLPVDRLYTKGALAI
ncbi:Tetratricopeptide TPR_2 repeat protein [Mycolicibacterium vanbaalenii PYR-1]|uniref:Tetratricopeptide TPR_2 repeat protein n=2 Tax=Mycolicibacterium vanbaalenii TaxID=110539 RepID=A1THW2_MYCVP|nr:Tetratricopeptide TPR_2 repeat protein [Mycolicibacterium vanbaalenii PYR-1]